MFNGVSGATILIIAQECYRTRMTRTGRIIADDARKDQRQSAVSASGCTIEARNFQRDLAQYEKAGAVILGVSVDTAESHKSFCAKEGLNFKLLADTEVKVSAAYGSVMEYNGNKLSARNTFIIDQQGKIAKVFPAVKVAKHSEEMLASLAELQKK